MRNVFFFSFFSPNDANWKKNDKVYITLNQLKIPTLYLDITRVMFDSRQNEDNHVICRNNLSHKSQDIPFQASFSPVEKYDLFSSAHPSQVTLYLETCNREQYSVEFCLALNR